MSRDMTSLVILCLACVCVAGAVGALGLRLVRGRSVALSLLILFLLQDLRLPGPVFLSTDLPHS